MTKRDKERYQETEELRKAIQQLKDRKFRLDCGHHVTFGHFLGNDITIYNGKNPTIICAQCGY